MSKSDSWTTKIIFGGLTLIVALLVYIWDDQKSDMAENTAAITFLREEVAEINDLITKAGYEKQLIQRDLDDHGKRLENIERVMP